MITRNPALAIVINNALIECPDRVGAVIHAAVHAWYEGHLEGEASQHRPRLRLVTVRAAARRGEAESSMPSPPFPAKGDTVLGDIESETLARFPNEIDAPGAVAFAAGLAWAEGYRKGVECRGVPSGAILCREQRSRSRSGRGRFSS